MEAAMQAAQDTDWALLSDSSWPGYTTRPHRLMEGYLVLMAEAIAQLSQVPSHIF
jgi:diaminopropionate ammonia-lyase